MINKCINTGSDKFNIYSSEQFIPLPCSSIILPSKKRRPPPPPPPPRPPPPQHIWIHSQQPPKPDPTPVIKEKQEEPEEPEEEFEELEEPEPEEPEPEEPEEPEPEPPGPPTGPALPIIPLGNLQVLPYPLAYIPCPGTILDNTTLQLPSGYLECNGAEASRKDYHLLYNMIGTYYGSQSNTTFTLPKLQGPDMRPNKYIIRYATQNIPVYKLTPVMDIENLIVSGTAKLNMC